jgi:hypothetical protein
MCPRYAGTRFKIHRSTIFHRRDSANRYVSTNEAHKKYDCAEMETLGFSPSQNKREEEISRDWLWKW